MHARLTVATAVLSFMQQHAISHKIAATWSEVVDPATLCVGTVQQRWCVLSQGCGTESFAHGTEGRSSNCLRKQPFSDVLHKVLQTAGVENQSLCTYASRPVIPGVGLAQHRQLHATPDLNQMCLRKPQCAHGTPIMPRAR